MKTPVLVVHAPGTNRDREVARAFQLAGGDPAIETVAELAAHPERLAEAGVIVLPGGFSYGDDLGAGRVWALQLAAHTPLGAAVRAHVARGRPLVGICNGFQALVKAGLLPGPRPASEPAAPPLVATLTRNAHGRFECRWVTLTPNPRSPSPFIAALTEPIRCPIAHGEGRLVFGDDATRAAVAALGLGALTYDQNPNGSEGDLAGLTDASGVVLGLMPHPEDHVVPHQHPDHHRGARDGSGLPLFRAIVAHARQT